MAKDVERAAAGVRRITQEDLRWLACPVCKDPLTLTNEADSHSVVCGGCERAYPVADGLPVLLADRAVRPD